MSELTEARRERIKLTATFMNNVGVAALAATGLAPSIAILLAAVGRDSGSSKNGGDFGGTLWALIFPDWQTSALVGFFIASGLLIALALHYSARRYLGHLDQR